MIHLVGLTYSIIAAVFSALFMYLAIQKKSERIFIISLILLLVSWSGMEWALWLLGHDLFKLVVEPIVPLATFFLVQTLIVIYLSEKNFRRRDWIGFVAAIAVLSVIAYFCMDCI